MPWELDYALLSFTQLKKSKYYLSSDDNIFVDITLNLSNYLIDWDNTEIPKSFFIEKFNSLQPLLNDYKCKFKIYDGNELYGGLNTMRESTESHIDHYITLNPDMYFTEHWLYILTQFSKKINNDFFMISSQIPKLWDNTWDIISNSNYSNIPHEQFKTIDVYDVRHYMKNNNLPVKLLITNEFKFAGWMDLFNKEMWENFLIKNEWNGYGGCDLYAIILANFAKKHGVNIQQYVIENQITIEYDGGSMNQSGYVQYYKKFIKMKDIPNQRQSFNLKMQEYLNSGIKSLIDKKIIKNLTYS